MAAREPAYITRAEAFNVIESLKPNFKTFINSEANAVATQMSAFYERKKRAWEMLNTSNRKTGKLDTSKIAKYKTSDNIFQKQSNAKEGANHGLTIVVDWSSSMYDVIAEMAQQLLVVMLYCKKSNIKFQLYFFTGDGVISFSTYHDIPLFESLMRGSFTFKKMLTHADSITDIQNFVINMIMYFFDMKSRIKSDVKIPDMAGTPLQDAAVSAYTAAQEFKKLHDIENNSIMFITDGEANGPIYNTTLIDPYSNRQYDSIPGKDLLFQINMMCRDAGFKVFNLYIGPSLGRRSIENGCEKSEDVDMISRFVDDNENSVFSIEEYYFYNEFICINPNLIKNDSGDIETMKKTYSQIGNIINEILCRSFKIK